MPSCPRFTLPHRVNAGRSCPHKKAHKDFLHPSWEVRRVITFSTTLGFGIVPVMHWSILSWEEPEAFAIFIPRVVASYTMMILGAAFYLSR